MAKGSGSRRRAGKELRRASGFAGITFCDIYYGRLSMLSPEDGDRAAAAAAGDLRAIQSAGRAGLAHQSHQQVGSFRAEPAGRIAGVRLVHQLAEQLTTTLAWRL